MARTIPPKRHVAIARRARTQLGHDRHLGCRGAPEVVAPQHITDAQGQFIHRCREVIGQKSIGAAEHHIPHRFRTIHIARCAVALAPPETTPGHPHAPTGQPLLHHAPAMGGPQAKARIDRAGSMGRGDIRQQAPTAAAGVKQPFAPQGRQHRGVQAAPPALPNHGPIPIEPEPLQIGLDRLRGPRPVTRGIEIVEPQ